MDRRLAGGLGAPGVADWIPGVTKSIFPFLRAPS